MLKYNFSILPIFISILLFSCSQEKTNYSIQTPLMIENIDSVIIKSHQSNSILSTTKRLSSNQSKKLIEKWNNAKTIGPCKYMWTYNIDVYLKDKTQRNFRVNGSIMKEQNDWGFDLVDTSYIDQIFLTSTQIQ